MHTSAHTTTSVVVPASRLASLRELRQLFSPYGAVVDCSVCRDRGTGASRGFGFVRFSQVGEAQMAITGLNGARGAVTRVATN